MPGTQAAKRPVPGIMSRPSLRKCAIVAAAGAGPWPQITSGLPLRVSHRMTGTSPPGPLRWGSTTCKVKAVAQAASNALPPFSSAAMPTAVAIQWVEVTTPKVPSISGRVVKGLGLMLLMRHHSSGPVPLSRARQQRCHRPRIRLRSSSYGEQERTIQYLTEGSVITGCPAFAGHDDLGMDLLRGLAQRRLRVDRVVKLGALPLRASDALLGGEIRRRANLVAPGTHVAQALEADFHQAAARGGAFVDDLLRGRH